MHSRNFQRKGLLLLLFSLLLFGLHVTSASSSPGNLTEGRWNEVVGKKVANSQGVTLGYIEDTALDIEHARYVGMIVQYGGFYGIGAKTKLVPPGVFADDGSRTLLLDMDEAAFRSAPTCELSGREGPPDAAALAEVYRYFGQTPYFMQQGASARTSRIQNLEKLGFVVKGSDILLMPVDNLQGKRLGSVVGLRDLDSRTGKFTGVIIAPSDTNGYAGVRILTPRSLRYDLNRNRLRLNDAAESFADSPTFSGLAGNPSTGYGDVYLQESARRPEVQFTPPVTQGNTDKDRRITIEIKKRISQNDLLSHYAQNIEVGTVAGQVTLQSRVENSFDRDQLMSLAAQVAGPGNVQDRLTIREMTRKEQNRDR